jgi:hypothetical protein
VLAYSCVLCTGTQCLRDRVRSDGRRKVIHHVRRTRRHSQSDIRGLSQAGRHTARCLRVIRQVCASVHSRQQYTVHAGYWHCHARTATTGRHENIFSHMAASLLSAYSPCVPFSDASISLHLTFSLLSSGLSASLGSIPDCVLRVPRTCWWLPNSPPLAHILLQPAAYHHNCSSNKQLEEGAHPCTDSSVFGVDVDRCVCCCLSGLSSA